MPPAPPAVEAVTGTRDQARPTGTSAPAAAPGWRGRAKAQMLPLRRSARIAQTALPAVTCQEDVGRARPEERGYRRRRMAGLPWRVPKTARSYHDPLFDRLDLVESDYYRLRHCPPGCPRPDASPGHHSPPITVTRATPGQRRHPGPASHRPVSPGRPGRGYLDIPSRQDRGLIDNPAPSAVRLAAGYLNGCAAAGQERGGQRNVTVHDRRALSGRAQSVPAGQELRIDGADLLMADREPPPWERQYRIGLIECDYCFHITRVGPLEEQIAQILRPPRRLGHSPSRHAPTVAPQCDIPRPGRPAGAPSSGSWRRARKARCLRALYCMTCSPAALASDAARRFAAA